MEKNHGLRRSIQSGSSPVSTEKDGLTLKNLITLYSQAYKLSPQTLSNLDFWERTIGNLGISEIKPTIVRNIIADRSKRYSISYLNRELSVLKRVLNSSIETGVIESNPLSVVSSLPGAVRRDRWITKEEEGKLLSYAPVWLGCIIRFALHTGMRRSEIVNLRWEHVFTDLGYLYVEKSKNGLKRNIPINAEVSAILTVAGVKECGYVFEGIKVGNLEYMFRKTVARSKIKDLHFHDLRHTFCTRLVQAGVDLFRVQLLAGHSSPIMTQRYAHHDVSSLRGAVDILVNN